MQVYLVLFAVVPLLAKEHCCKKKIVNGVDYNLLKVSDGDLNLDFDCLNNCVYSRPDSSTNFCFAHGNYQPKCLEPSVTSTTFHSEAKDMSSTVEALYLNKTEEYGNMKQFTSLKDKLAWIKNDIYMAGEPFFKPTKMKKSYLTIVPCSKMNKFLKMDENFEKHIKKIMADYNDPDPDKVKQALDKMEEDMLHHTQNDHEMHQAAHFGVSATRLALKLLKRDEEGNTAVDKMVSAIMNNTDSKSNRYKQTRGVATDIAKETAGGAASGAVVGAIVGGIGAVPGAIVGAASGLAIGTAKAAVGAVGHAVGCFSTTSQVETLFGFKELQEVAIGDFIRTSSGGLETHFTEFIGWLDRHESSPVQMLQVWTSQNLSPQTLTGSHIVFTPTSTKYADELLPGDSLLHWNGTSMQEQEVKRILTTLEFGFWAPLTMDGTLLVDGYLSSCYASFPHQLSDIAMKPVKTLPSILLDNEESQHKDGVHSVVKMIKKVGELLGTRKQKSNDDGHFPNVAENIVASFIEKSEF